MQTIQIPTKVTFGKIFEVEGVTPKTLRTGEPFEIDAWLDAEKWSNGQVFAKVKDSYGIETVKLIDPVTVEFIAKN